MAGILNIGRSRENEIILGDNKISNFHAQLITDEEGKVFINDLN